MAEIINITQKPMYDTNIQEYEYYEYEPQTGTNLNNTSAIRINIETQDLFLHPAESYILIQGQLVKKSDGSLFANTDPISLTNNGVMYLFNNIKYQLANNEIESINNPGFASTMLGSLIYTDDFSKSTGLNQCWVKDTSIGADETNSGGFKTRHEYIIQKSDPKGSFSFCIPLKHIFGFMDTYEKIIYGFKHTLTFVRTTDDNAIYHDSGDLEGKIKLNKLSWFMPQILPSLTTETQLLKVINNKTIIDVWYKMRQCDQINVTESTDFNWKLGVKSGSEKPRWIIIGFQTDKEDQQKKNPAVFDHCNLQNMYVMLNSRRYPMNDYQIDFEQNHFSRIYKDAVDFRQNFYDLDKIFNLSNIDPLQYKTLFPLFVFDVSKQSEKLKDSVTDIQIKMKLKKNVPKKTKAYAVVISDRLLKFQSNGNKMDVIF